MASPYSIRFREFGRGPATTRRFQTLEGLQDYCKKQWQGVEYMDSPRSFHSDYCQFDITGASLFELGQRRSDDRADYDYWCWEWKNLNPAPEPTPEPEFEPEPETCGLCCATVCRCLYDEVPF